MNSRLDSIQAIVAHWLIRQVHQITEQRIANAALYDAAFVDMADDIVIPPRRSGIQRVFHLYMLYVRDRDRLYRYLNENGVEAKIHYPIPLPLQKGLAHLGYGPGDFPETERQAYNTLTLPVDQHLAQDEIAYTINVVKQFYRR